MSVLGDDRTAEAGNRVAGNTRQSRCIGAYPLATLLRAVRLLGRFPGVSYVLAYDELTLLGNLQGAELSVASADQGRLFLEKIVQRLAGPWDDDDMGWKRSALDLARKVKHAGLVASKSGTALGLWAKYAAMTAVGDSYARLRPYEFDPTRYRRSFLVREPPVNDGHSEFPRRVFVLWTGNNDLSPNRARNLELLRARIGLPVEVVTPANLDRWIVPGHPLRPAYEHLSLVHRSDYLRAYLMHHHGGGYADLKLPLASWESAYVTAAADPDAWVTSYPSDRAEWAAKLPGRLGADVLLHHQRLLGNGAYLVRSHTPFTAEWLREVERRVDYYAEQAAEFPGGVRGEVVGYPVSWNRILSNVFDPLTLKYLAYTRQTRDLLMEFEDYQ